MERTVPRTASEEIELYLRTIYSLLRTTDEVQIRTLEEVHAGTNSLLHPDARKPVPDMAAFLYSLQRLPHCIRYVKTVVLGQNAEVFQRHGYQDIYQWQELSAPARRRRCFYDGDQTMACFIASRTDIDDMIPAMTALQIEWNKLHHQFLRIPESFDYQKILNDRELFVKLAEFLDISETDLDRLRLVWGEDFLDNLQLIKSKRLNLGIRLLSGSFSEYRRSTHFWWSHIETEFPELINRPVYFISSNNHSISNLITGYALQKKDILLQFLENSGDEELKSEWKRIQKNPSASSVENFFYYLLKKYQQSDEGSYTAEEQILLESTCAIKRIDSKHSFYIDAQIVDIACIDLEKMDPRLNLDDMSFIKKSNALILNIDYPLGLAAYNILGIISEHIVQMMGIYLMGKAATLNGVIGDVMIPNVVHDEHSRNTYLFDNVFEAGQISPYLISGTVLDHQKAVSVLGTFLQNAKWMDVFYREGYTDIEMEAGSYLSAVYEMYRPKRHPVNEIVNLYEVPFDIGVIHYASDTPLSKGKNLGAGTMSYRGMDSTYASTVAILRHIFQKEQKRCQTLGRTE